MYGAFGSNALAMFIYVLFTGPFEEDKISSDSNFLFFIKLVYVKIETSFRLLFPHIWPNSDNQDVHGHCPAILFQLYHIFQLELLT